MAEPTGPLAGEPRHRYEWRGGQGPAPSRARRLAAWLAWWIVAMSLWVAIDDSFEPDELVAGAVAAALAALVAEIVGYQAGTRYRIRPSWLLRALSLPGRLAADTVLVFGALAATVLRRTAPPPGAFREVPVPYGDETPLGETRRILLIAGRSFTPNGFVVGMDREAGTMLVHELVTRR